MERAGILPLAAYLRGMGAADAPFRSCRRASSVFSLLLAGLGFSISSGLNAYLPLLVLAFADAAGTAVELESPYDWVSSPIGLIVLLLVLPLELIGDKIPRLDRYNDRLHTVIRPLAGGFGFMALASQDDDLNVWVAGILGLVIAAATHVWKMRSRIAIASATSGLGTPIVSMLEDAIVIVVSICSAFVPIANIVAIPLGLATLGRSYRRMTTGESRVIRVFQPKRRP